MDFILEHLQGVAADVVSSEPDAKLSSELNELQLALVGGGIGDFIPY